jgi:hypothetical protein
MGARGEPSSSVDRARRLPRTLGGAFTLLSLLTLLPGPGCGGSSSECWWIGGRDCGQWSGDPSCDADGCHSVPSCVDQCGDFGESDCGQVTGCAWQPVTDPYIPTHTGDCVATTDICSKSSYNACNTTRACKHSTLCEGTPFDCKSVEDQATCQAHPHCYWNPDTDGYGTRY